MSPELRAEAHQSLAADMSSAHLPLFTNYAEYDFRNEQSILLLEDLLWEAPYSTYSFYDYIALADSCSKGAEVTPIVTEAATLGVAEDLGSGSIADTSAKQAILSNPQSDDSVLVAPLAISSEYVKFPVSSELSEVDDQYLKLKAHSVRLKEWDTNARLLSSSLQTSASYLQVFNQFTTAYEDYG